MITERLWCALVSVVLAMVAAWGAHPVSVDAPWQTVRVVMAAGAVVSVVGVVFPHLLSKARAALVGFGFLARATIVASGVDGFPSWQSRAIAAATYAGLGVATVMLATAWEAARDLR